MLISSHTSLMDEGSETIENLIVSRVGCKRNRSARPHNVGEDIVRSLWKHKAANLICGIYLANIYELLKIPTEYGLSRGVAWFALLGFGLVHTAAMDSATNARIVMWDSAA